MILKLLASSTFSWWAINSKNGRQKSQNEQEQSLEHKNRLQCEKEPFQHKACAELVKVWWFLLDKVPISWKGSWSISSEVVTDTHEKEYM